ncbi:hypothetical protein BJI48_01875 [Helicobacter sp. 11S02596-1]|nr:hypothetical protein BJI48_01875 [Helicobacter sp. 11S02596-1]
MIIIFINRKIILAIFLITLTLIFIARFYGLYLMDILYIFVLMFGAMVLLLFAFIRLIINIIKVIKRKRNAYKS